MDDKEKLTDAEKMLAVIMALGEDDRVKQQQDMNIAANTMHDLYEAYVASGFSRKEAFELVKETIRASLAMVKK